MSLTEELKQNHNNIMTVMENRVMSMTGCNRTMANLVANEILNLELESEQILSKKEN